MISGISKLGGLLKYDIVLSRDESGWYVVECLNLPGCVSQGKTKKEATANIKDAIRGYLTSLKKHPGDFAYRKVEEVRAVSL